jgi:hypothetical protein
MMQGQMMQGGMAVAWPDRLDRYERMLSGRLEAVRALKVAAQPLYAVLTDEQKKLADQLMSSPMGMM